MNYKYQLNLYKNLSHYFIHTILILKILLFVKNQELKSSLIQKVITSSLPPFEDNLHFFWNKQTSPVTT